MSGNLCAARLRYGVAMRKLTSIDTFACAAAAALLLSACSGSDEAAEDAAAAGTATAETDPALTGALGDQIAVDPDLVGQNRANGAAAIPSQNGAVPTIDSGPEAVAAARAEALKLVGGPGKLRKAPEAVKVTGELPATAALTAAARVATARDSNRDCAARVQYSTRWAAQLPLAFPVYPHGAVQEAAGTDASGCSLRVVNFLTPVPVGEVMDFYFTQASAAGYSAERVLQDGDDVLAGVKNGASYVVYARKTRSGATEVDLVIGG